MIDNKTYGVRTGSHTAATSPASISMVNLVEGVVHSQHVGLLHTMVRIHAGRRVDLRIRLPLADERCFFPGQPVIAMIPAEAVRLEAGFFRRSRQRLNRWYGRIVLIKRVDEGQLLTAKLHREGWTPHQYEAGLGICSFSSNLGSRHYRRRSRKDRLGPSSTRGPDRAKGPFPLQARLPTGEIVSVTSVSTIKKGACMTVSSRLLFITLVGFLGYSSFVMTDSLRAQ